MSQTIIISGDAKGNKLSDWLIAHGYSVPAACGGRGTCGKCGVRVLKGVFYSEESPDTPLCADNEGRILSCRAVCGKDEAVIALDDSDGTGLVDFTVSPAADADEKSGFGIALDIGTTTLAAALVDRANGKTIGTYSTLNPQRVYGADVITRISACTEGKTGKLSSLIISAAADIIAYFKEAFPDKKPNDLYVTGNTTMLHLFCSTSPVSMGTYPFNPVFTDIKTGSGKAFGLSVERVTVLPSASAFIGGDIMCGVALCRMTELEQPSVLIDMGTNGEIAVCTGKARKSRLIAASAAAGPALEGANISCGVGGIPGAVCEVMSSSEKNGCPTFKTIEDLPVTGLCGCGLIDFIYMLVNTGEIDETGLLENGDYTLVGKHLDKKGEPLTITDSKRLTLTQKDIREFQLAKSALRSALEALLSYAELSLNQLERVFIAGGLGCYMNTESAVGTGILPSELKKNTVTVGNSALGGAVCALTSEKTLKKIQLLSKSCETFELSTSAVFSKAFMDNMFFDTE